MVGILEIRKKRGVNLKMGKSRYSTFFFKEYEGMAEKNTYSAYIPNEWRGFWILVAESEDKTGLAKEGAEEGVVKYMENSIFSMENMDNLLNAVNEKIIKKRILKGRSRNSEASILVVIAEKARLISGNIGKTGLKVFRNNKVYEDVSGNRMKDISLSESDYILIGSPEFWETVDENEISDMLINSSSRWELEKLLSEKIKEKEKLINAPIPFMSIFIEELEKEVIGYVSVVNRKNPLKYFLVLLVILFFFVGTGKSFQNRKYMKKAKEYTRSSEKYFKDGKYEDAINEMENAFTFYKKIHPKNENVDIAVNELEKKKKMAEKERERLLEIKKRIPLNIGMENNNVAVIVSSVAENEQKNLKESQTEKVRTGKEKALSEKKVSNLRTKKVKRTKKRKELTPISDLEEEIQRNWVILGRDKNGNKK